MASLRSQKTLDTVERATELPMLVLSVAMIPLLLVPLLLDLTPEVDDALLMADWVVWAAFGMELVVKTYLAPARGVYLRQHWFDVLIVALPFLRPLRIVRSARAVRSLRALRLFAFAGRVAHSANALLNAHGLKYALATGAFVIVASAGLVSAFEGGTGGNINGFGDALWWAATTVTTVGYGDKFPVTPEGRGMAVFLMLVGISLFSLLTASVAAFLVKPAPEGVSLEDLMHQLRALEAKVDELRGSRVGTDSS